MEYVLRSVSDCPPPFQAWGSCSQLQTAQDRKLPASGGFGLAAHTTRARTHCMPSSLLADDKYPVPNTARIYPAFSGIRLARGWQDMSPFMHIHIVKASTESRPRPPQTALWQVANSGSHWQNLRVCGASPVLGWRRDGGSVRPWEQVPFAGLDLYTSWYEY